jgi:hypothetical protein
LQAGRLRSESKDDSLGRAPGTGHWPPATHQARSVLSSPFMGNLLWLIIVILLILWLGGFAFHVGGGLIHLLLVIAVIVLIFQLITGRRAI